LKRRPSTVVAQPEAVALTIALTLALVVGLTVGIAIGEEVQLPGFGKFYVREQKAREGKTLRPERGCR
jgi:nucleoid DNA-binding protein